eukprot:1083097-Rhodomonas_salina.2
MLGEFQLHGRTFRREMTTFNRLPQLAEHPKQAVLSTTRTAHCEILLSTSVPQIGYLALLKFKSVPRTSGVERTG